MRAGFFLLLASIVAAGIATLGYGTEGFRVITSEGARRLAVERAPKTVPNVSLIDQDGVSFSLDDYRGKVLLIEFIYTSCPTLCGVLGEDFRRVEDLILHDGGINQAVSLLSISFDTARNGPAELKSYGERFGAASPRWRIAVPTASGLQTLLRAFSVVIIRDGWGGFVHNGAVCVVDRQGRLIQIVDAGLPERMLKQVMQSAS